MAVRADSAVRSRWPSSRNVRWGLGVAFIVVSIALVRIEGARRVMVPLAALSIPPRRGSYRQAVLPANQL